MLHNLEFKMQLLAAHDVAKIELPKFAREAKRGPVLVQVGNEFQTEYAPEIGEADVHADRLQFDSRVERKWSALGHETSEGITVEVIPMCGISRPIGIGVMRSNNLDSSTRPCDAIKLRDKGDHVGHVLDNVAADNLIELIVAEGIRHKPEVVNNIGMAAWVRVDAYSAGVLVLSASDVKDLLALAIQRFQLCGSLMHSSKDGGMWLGKHGDK